MTETAAAALLAVCLLGCGDNLAGPAPIAADAAPERYCGATRCLEIAAVQTVEDIGRGQGVEWREQRLYLYGDRDTGVVREYRLDGDVAAFTGLEVALTEGGDDLLAHPTGLTTRPGVGTWIGNTVSRRGSLFLLDWQAALAARTLDGAVLHRVSDGAAVEGSRPELVLVGGRWLIASADYGDAGNALRLYDPEALAAAGDTAEAGVLVDEIAVGPFVQSLAYLEAEDVLVLVQNTSRGRGWRLTFLALGESLAAGEARVSDVIDLPFSSELEGFHAVGGGRVALLTSGAADNLVVGRLW